MKNLYSKLFVVCCSIIAFACSKNANSIHNNSIIGNWELSYTSGGFAPDSIYPKNNGNLYSFTQDSVKQYKNGQLINKDIYRIRMNNNIDSIYFGNTAMNGSSIKISNDTLYFNLEAVAYDGIASIYVKIPNN